MPVSILAAILFPVVISIGKAAYMGSKAADAPGPSGKDRQKRHMSEHVRSPHSIKREVSGEGGRLSHTLVSLWPYIWPSDRPDLQRRVIWSLLLLVAAKLATLAVPFAFKFATDSLARDGGTAGSAAGVGWIAWALAAPLLLTAGYGGMRILMALLTQARDGLFAKVA